MAGKARFCSPYSEAPKLALEQKSWKLTTFIQGDLVTSIFNGTAITAIGGTPAQEVPTAIFGARSILNSGLELGLWELPGWEPRDSFPQHDRRRSLVAGIVSKHRPCTRTARRRT